MSDSPLISSCYTDTNKIVESRQLEQALDQVLHSWWMFPCNHRSIQFMQPWKGDQAQAEQDQAADPGDQGSIGRADLVSQGADQ